MASFITVEEANLPVPTKSRELKVCPAIIKGSVSMSAASYKTDDFHLVIVLKQNGRIAVRLKNGAVEFDYHGRGGNTQFLYEPGHGHGGGDGSGAAVEMDLHKEKNDGKREGKELSVLPVGSRRQTMFARISKEIS